jgi:hypothetical protein
MRLAPLVLIAAVVAGLVVTDADACPWRHRRAFSYPCPPPQYISSGPTTKVRLLFIGDTNASEGGKQDAVGRACEAEITAVKTALLAALPDDCRDAEKEVAVRVGSDVKQKELMEFIKNWDVKSNEAVFCYFTGHGGYDPNLAQTDNSRDTTSSFRKERSTRKKCSNRISSRRYSRSALV